jgi:membrane protease YdiL (CAAX protease family)
VVIALLAAICEELFFRGLLQKTLSEHINQHTAIWVTALIFSAVHFQFYGFLPRMLLGAAFGYMVVWSGSLWLPILAHFINNAVGVIAFFIAKKQNFNFDIENVGAENSWYIGLLFVPICIYFLIRIIPQLPIFFRLQK